MAGEGLLIRARVSGQRRGWMMLHEGGGSFTAGVERVVETGEAKRIQIPDVQSIAPSASRKPMTRISRGYRHSGRG